MSRRFERVLEVEGGRRGARETVYGRVPGAAAGERLSGRGPDLEGCVAAFWRHRGVVAPSRHRRASSAGEKVVGGLFFDFEAVWTDVFIT